mgnify:CR=1 FL=1
MIQAYFYSLSIYNLKFVIGDDHDVLNRLINGAKLVDANIVFRVTSENPFLFIFLCQLSISRVNFFPFFAVCMTKAIKSVITIVGLPGNDFTKP